MHKPFQITGVFIGQENITSLILPSLQKPTLHKTPTKAIPAMATESNEPDFALQWRLGTIARFTVVARAECIATSITLFLSFPFLSSPHPPLKSRTSNFLKRPSTFHTHLIVPISKNPTFPQQFHNNAIRHLTTQTQLQTLIQRKAAKNTNPSRIPTSYKKSSHQKPTTMFSNSIR